MGTVAEFVNIDMKPEVAFQTEATVVVDEHGKPHLRPEPLSRWYAQLGRFVGKGRLRVSISREKGPRSDQQNKYLWAVVYEDYYQAIKARCADVGLECPFKSKDDLHYHLKHKYLSQTIAHLFDEDVVMEPTTTKLNIEQFSTYVNLIMAEAAQRGMYIRSAGEE